MRVLKARLYKRRLDEEAEKAQAKAGEKREIAFGSQIRSYVLHPYKMVKDHRSGMEVTDPGKVLDGDLDQFMEASLKAGL